MVTLDDGRELQDACIEDHLLRVGIHTVSSHSQIMGWEQILVWSHLDAVGVCMGVRRRSWRAQKIVVRVGEDAGGQNPLCLMGDFLFDTDEEQILVVSH